MEILVGNQYTISGMTIEIIADQGDTWLTRNITTHEIVTFDKSMLEKAIRLGMADDVSE
jgi:hypothetical protein